MNILILNWRDVRHPKSGGAELVTMEHAKGWIRAGHRVTWLTAAYEGARKESVVDGVMFVRRAGSFTVYLYAWIYLLLNARWFDLIVDEVHGFPFFSPLFTRKPVVVFIHEIAGEIWDYMFPFPKNILGKLLEGLYFRLYRKCFFWTDAPSTVKELVSRGIPAKQCVAIPCPIIEQQGTENRKQETDNRKQKKEKNPTFLFVSRVVRMKGIEEVIKAFSFIVRSQPDAMLWIVGGGEEGYIHELKRMIEDYGVSSRVKFFGVVSDTKKYRLMTRAHLLLHASVKEGWGLVVLEAARVGTPAVVYNVSGLCDVVKDGKTGVVLTHNSPREMAREALSLVADEKRYAAMQEAGLHWVKSLTWEKAVKQSLALLMSAIKQHDH